MITNTEISLCSACRELAREVTCPLCLARYDPFDGPSRRRYPSCRDCRHLYRRGRTHDWYPLLSAVH